MAFKSPRDYLSLQPWNLIGCMWRVSRGIGSSHNSTNLYWNYLCTLYSNHCLPLGTEGNAIKGRQSTEEVCWKEREIYEIKNEGDTLIEPDEVTVTHSIVDLQELLLK